MDRENYKVQHTLLLFEQWLFLVVALFATGYEIVTGFGHVLADSKLNGIPYILHFLWVVSIIIYAAFGYKKKPVYYNACITLYEFSILFNIVYPMLVDTASAERTVFSIISVILLLLVFAYANTFKKHKKIALVLGGTIALTELLYGVFQLISLLQAHPSRPIVVVEHQVFVQFFAAVAMLTGYVVRTHWSLGGKPGADE